MGDIAAVLPIAEETKSVSTAQVFDFKDLFALPREGNKAHPFTTGKDYMEDLAGAIAGAQKFIFIWDWELDYDVELIQRGDAGHPGRLSELLAAALKRGVHVRVMLYKSIHLAVDTHDTIAEAALKKVGATAGGSTLEVVLQAPNTGRSGPIERKEFSHHQKGVLIDGKTAYIGGMDIAYTRWDTANFEVIIDRNIRVLAEGHNEMLKPGRKLTYSELELGKEGPGGRPGFWLPDKTLLGGYHTLEEGYQPREPWQDVHVRMDGPAAFDVFKNFVRRWNVAASDSQRLKQGWLGLDNKANDFLPDPLARGQGHVKIQVLRSCSFREQMDEFKTRPLYLGNLSTEDSWKQPDKAKQPNEETPKEDQVSIKRAMLKAIAGANAYIYIENQFFMSKCGDIGPQSKNNYKALTYISENEVMSAIATTISATIFNDTPFHVYLVMPVHPEGCLDDNNIQATQYWTLHAIKHGSQSLYRLIKEALYIKKHLPEINNFNISALNKSTKSLSRPDLDREVSDSEVERYLTVLNLRNFGVGIARKRDPKSQESTIEAGRFLLTEQVYVHSKLMIVDDAIAIIGSANINDRSLQGNGDTEIAAVLVDEEHDERDLGGVKVVTRTFARELRKALWSKHLGLGIDESAYAHVKDGLPPPRRKGSVPPGLDLDRPMDQKTVEAIQKLAKGNAAAYEKVFLHTLRNGFENFVDPVAFYPKGLAGPPPALQPSYMDKENHDVNKALNDLKSEADGVKGFWTAAPLDWGFAVGDKVPIPTPSHGWTELIAENPAPTSPDLTAKA